MAEAARLPAECGTSTASTTAMSSTIPHLRSIPRGSPEDQYLQSRILQYWPYSSLALDYVPTSGPGAFKKVPNSVLQNDPKFLEFAARTVGDNAMPNPIGLGNREFDQLCKDRANYVWSLKNDGTRYMIAFIKNQYNPEQHGERRPLERSKIKIVQNETSARALENLPLFMKTDNDNVAITAPAAATSRSIDAEQATQKMYEKYQCIAMDRTGQKFELEYSESPAVLFRGTLIDVEYVFDDRLPPEDQHSIVLLDIMVLFGSHYVSELNFIQRYTYLLEQMQGTSFVAETVPALSLLKKHVPMRLCGKDWHSVAETFNRDALAAYGLELIAGRTPHEPVTIRSNTFMPGPKMDGLIFMPISHAIRQGTNHFMFKWKPHHELDLQVFVWTTKCKNRKYCPWCQRGLEMPQTQTSEASRVLLAILPHIHHFVTFDNSLASVLESPSPENWRLLSTNHGMCSIHVDHEIYLHHFPMNVFVGEAAPDECNDNDNNLRTSAGVPKRHASHFSLRFFPMTPEWEWLQLSRYDAATMLIRKWLEQIRSELPTTGANPSTSSKPFDITPSHSSPAVQFHSTHRIVECSLHRDANKSGADGMMQFWQEDIMLRMYRFRQNKTQPNSHTTIRETLIQLCGNPIDFSKLWTADGCPEY